MGTGNIRKQIFNFWGTGVHFGYNRLKKYRGGQSAGPIGCVETQAVLVTYSTSCSGQLLRDQFSLLLFHKIQYGTLSIDKDKYLTPAHRLKKTHRGEVACLAGSIPGFSGLLDKTLSHDIITIWP